jgi:uncharacterized phiE125 gp8 family phage protein
MALKLITPAAALAVSLSEAKVHLRVDVADDDALITALITAATEFAEQETGRSIMPQTWELTLDAFPEAFKLQQIPVASVTSLKYVDVNGVMQTLSAPNYALDAADDFAPAYVVPAYGVDWPSTRSQANAVALRYVAGYASAAAVPEGIKAWIKLQLGALYETRQAEGSKMSFKFDLSSRLLDRFRVWVL